MNIKMESGVSTVTSSSQTKSSEQSNTSDNDTNASAYDFLANLLAQMDAIVQETSQQGGQLAAATTAEQVELPVDADVSSASIQANLEDDYSFLTNNTNDKSTAYLAEQGMQPAVDNVDALKFEEELNTIDVAKQQTTASQVSQQTVNQDKIQQSVANEKLQTVTLSDEVNATPVQDSSPQLNENAKTIHTDKHDKIEIDLSQAGSLNRGTLDGKQLGLESSFSDSSANQQGFADSAAANQTNIENAVTGSAQHAAVTSDFSKIAGMSNSNPTVLQQSAKPADPSQYRFDVEMPKEVMAGAEGVENQSYMIKLKVYPPNLGKMVTKVTIKDGQASLKIVAESEHSREIVINNIQQLRDQFAESNITLMDVDVSSSNSEERQSEDMQQFAAAEIRDDNNQPVKAAKKEKTDNDQLVDTYV